jgi:hypothetical protein
MVHMARPLQHALQQQPRMRNVATPTPAKLFLVAFLAVGSSADGKL